jgi:CubicO group peptidase (beta-lactamase class C family)
MGEGPVAATDVGQLNRLAPAVDLLDRLVNEEQVGGAALVVSMGGKPVAEIYRGLAAGQAASESTLWPLASTTKLYTAATIFALVEQGVLTLSMPVQSILPTFTGDGRERITIRHLLTHTSGVPYEPEDMEKLLVEQRPMEDILSAAFTQPLLFPPGTGWSYSDLGFGLLGQVAAQAASIDYHELVRQLILEPAALNDTFLIPPSEVEPRIAEVVGAMASGTDGAMYNSAYARGLAHPAFGAIATVNDLLQFGLLFTTHSQRALFSRASIQTMTTDQVGAVSWAEPDSPLARSLRVWGGGFMLKGTAGYPALASPWSYGHPGATGCILWIDPGHDVVIAFVSNRHSGADTDEGKFTQRLERVVNVVLASLTRND